MPKTRGLTRRLTALVAALALVGAALPAAAAPAGPPIRIGSTLALTGPLAPTALIHKIAGEIYVEQLNRGTGLLGRPVEWVAARRSVQARRHAQPLREAHHRGQGGPHHGALRHQRHPRRHGRGPALPEDDHPPQLRHAAPGHLRDALPGRALRARAAEDGPRHGVRRPGHHQDPAQDGGHRHQQVSLRPVPVQRRPRSGREARTEGRCSTSSTSSARGTGARSPRG